MSNKQARPTDDVAIVSMGLKFPGNILTLDDLWKTLQSEQSTAQDASLCGRWSSLEESNMAQVQGRSVSLVDNLEHFDPSYFGISLSEAESMDPHQRLLLETVERALVQIRTNLKEETLSLRSEEPDEVSTSVYVGMSSTEYQSMLRGSSSVYAATGGALSVAAGRISYLHGWQGAAVVVNTEDSSSLTALHQACAALRSRECQRSVVAGVSLILSPGGVSSAICRGEGCGAVILKRLADAERDGDFVYGVIRGSAVMQDGKSATLTTQSVNMQVVRAALSDAGVRAADVCYVEAHGTGTKLGDLIEAEALSAVYSESSVHLGTVKANIGHLQAAAGMAGLFAALAALQHAAASSGAGDDDCLLAAVSSRSTAGSLAHVVVASRARDRVSPPPQWVAHIPQYTPVVVPYTRAHPQAQLQQTHIPAPVAQRAVDPCSAQRRDRDDVAIIGLSCQFPGGVTDLSSLWSVMQTGKDCTSEVPASRWDTAAITAHYAGQVDPDTLSRIRHGGFLADDELHGAPMETTECIAGSVYAAVCAKLGASDDLSHRLLLHGTLAAIADCVAKNTPNTNTNTNTNTSANTNPSHPYRSCDSMAACLRDANTGVFVGGPGLLNQTTPEGHCGQNVSQPTHSSLAAAASGIAEAFELTGPCLATDTACSASLVALHLAVRSLQRGECGVAIAAAVHIIRLEMSMACAVAGMLSPDGKCHTFDEGANGYVRGEGCGAVILKRLADAERDGDFVYGVIRGSAVMQDGKSASLTAPNGRAQEALMRAALSDAGVSAADVCYVEAHGTGTKLGDPIEAEALSAVYGSKSGGGETPVYVGGVKANIGHLETAAGMAGLFAALAALQHAEAPSNGQLRTLNTRVAKMAQNTRLRFPTEGVGLLCTQTISTCTSAPNFSDSLFAGVSSFGYSGTIGHLILEVSPSRSKSVAGSENQVTTPASPPVIIAPRPVVQPHSMAQFWEVNRADRRILTCYMHARLLGLLRTVKGAATARPVDIALALLLELAVAAVGREYGHSSTVQITKISFLGRNIAPLAAHLAHASSSLEGEYTPAPLHCVMDIRACSIHVYTTADRPAVNEQTDHGVSLADRMRRARAPLQKALLLTASYSVVGGGGPHVGVTNFEIFTEALHTLDQDNERGSHDPSKLLVTSLDAILGPNLQQVSVTLSAERRFWPAEANTQPQQQQQRYQQSQVGVAEVMRIIKSELHDVTGIRCVPVTESADAEMCVCEDTCLLGVLDSLAAIALSARLSLAFKSLCRQPLPSTLLYTHSTVRQLSQRITDSRDGSSAAPSGTAANIFTTFPCGDDVPRGRLLVFGGQMQHSSAWRDMADHWTTTDGLVVHVYNLPGRHERSHEAPAEHLSDLVREVCLGLATAGWLDDGFPLYVLGYSFGACLAYETVRFIEHQLSGELERSTATATATASRLILVAGPTRADLNGVQLFEADATSFGAALSANLGVVPKSFSEFLASNSESPEVITQVLSWGVLDQMYQQQWCALYDSTESYKQRISCGISCLHGTNDAAVTYTGWRALMADGFGFEQLLYPGNHFFIFDTNDVDNQIAKDVAASCMCTPPGNAQ